MTTPAPGSAGVPATGAPAGWRAWVRVDVILGALITGMMLFTIAVVALGAGSPPPWAYFATLMFAGLIVLWRRPGAVSAAIMVIALCHYLIGALGGISTTVHVGDVMVPVAVFYATWLGTRRDQMVALGCGLLGALLLSTWIVWPGAPVPRGWADWSSIASAVILSVAIASTVLAAWAFGLLARSLSRQAELRRARQLAEMQELERSSELATVEERNRIAREMHDIVAHSLSVIIAQSDGGRYASRTSPEAATSALETIGTTGRDALTEMRRLLGVLRADPGAEYSPQATFADIPDLVRRVAETGVAVELRTSGAPYEIPSGIGVASYRIVQEALTNVLKHAGPGATAEVLLDYRPDGLGIVVDDDGRGTSAPSDARGAPAPSDGRGHGILGMRERVGAYGGSLVTGPRRGGGFRVAVHWAAGAPPPAGSPAVPSRPDRQEHPA